MMLMTRPATAPGAEERVWTNLPARSAWWRRKRGAVVEARRRPPGTCRRQQMADALAGWVGARVGEGALSRWAWSWVWAWREQWLRAPSEPSGWRPSQPELVATRPELPPPTRPSCGNDHSTARLLTERGAGGDSTGSGCERRAERERGHRVRRGEEDNRARGRGGARRGGSPAALTRAAAPGSRWGPAAASAPRSAGGDRCAHRSGPDRRSPGGRAVRRALSARASRSSREALATP